MDNKVNYKKLYSDFLMAHYPEKLEENSKLLSKKKIISLDIIEFDKLISKKKDLKENNRFKSYDKESICRIIEYQRKNGLNNSQLAKHFNLSRNTITRWKKNFL